jgi:ABC-type multidrug transport system permease subunit
MADMADDKRKVVVTDVKSPFVSMVVLMGKWAAAAIPALIILLVIGAVASTVIAAIFGDVMPHWGMNKWWAR